jgi:hypothetical protein
MALLNRRFFDLDDKFTSGSLFCPNDSCPGLNIGSIVITDGSASLSLNRPFVICTGEFEDAGRGKAYPILMVFAFLRYADLHGALRSDVRCLMLKAYELR